MDCREEPARYDDTIGRRQIQSVAGENVEIQDIYTYSRSGLYHSGRCGRSWKGESARLGPGRRGHGAAGKNAPCNRCRSEVAGHRLHISCDKSLLESNLFVLKPETLEDVVGSRGSIPWMGGIAREVHDGREGNGGAVQIIWLHRILYYTNL